MGEEYEDLYKLAKSAFAKSTQECKAPMVDEATHLLEDAYAKLTAHDSNVPYLLKPIVKTLLIRFHQTTALSELDQALVLCEHLDKVNTTNSKPEDHPPIQMVFKTADSAMALIDEFNNAPQILTLNEAIALYRKASSFSSLPRCKRSECLRDLALALEVRFRRTGVVGDIEEAIELYREGLSLIPPHRGRWWSLNVLCVLLLQNFVDESDSQSFANALALRKEANSLANETMVLFSGANSLYGKFLESGQLSDLDTVESIYRQVLDSLPAGHFEMWRVSNNLASAVRKRFDHNGQAGHLDEAILLYRDTLKFIPPSRPECSTVHHDLGNCLYRRFELASQVADLDEAISMFDKALELCPSEPPLQSKSLNELAIAFHGRFERTGQATDLDKSIEYHRDALRLSSNHNLDKTVSLSNLSLILLGRYDQKKEFNDLDEAIALIREALTLQPPSHPGRQLLLNKLGDALYNRFTRLGNVADLHQAITLHRESLALCLESHGDMLFPLYSLGNTLLQIFQQTSEIADLEEAITLLQEALKLCPSPNPSRHTTMNTLASAFRAKFQWTSQTVELDEAISLFRKVLEIVPPTHAERYISLNNLAVSLHERFEHTGQMVDLDHAIVLHRETLASIPPNSLTRPLLTSNLANTLQERYEQNGQMSDLEEAVSLYNEALEQMPTADPNRPAVLGNLGSTIHHRFSRTGQIADLDQAIRLHRQTLELRPAHHLYRPASLNNLANALRERFEYTSQDVDVDEAIFLHRQALELRPKPHPERPSSLFNLANALHFRSLKTKQHTTDLDEAALLLREGLELQPPPHPHRLVLLNSLGTVLVTFFIQTRHVSYLDEAISIHRDDIGMRGLHHYGRLQSLSNLADALLRKSLETGGADELEEAILTIQNALEELPKEDPHMCRFSRILGRALVLKHSRYGSSTSSEYLKQSTIVFRTATLHQIASISERFEIARYWAEAAHHDDPRSAMEAYQTAIELLPRLAMPGLDLKSRQHALTMGSDGLARNAAACAIQLGLYEHSIEFLEEGRSIFWSQALQLRTSTDKLKEVAKDLAQKLEGLARALERGSFRDASRTIQDTPQRVTSLEQEAVRYRDLNEEWLATLASVRELEGFHDFLRRKTFSTLQKASNHGTVAILNASEFGCAALLLTSSGVTHVPLLDFDFATAERLVSTIRNLPYGTYRDSQERHLKRTLPKSDSEFRSVLAKLWTSVVKPILHSLGLQKSAFPPRLWWCPTGIFSFLPIHASGIYQGEQKDDISNYVISSYTPTLTTLMTSPPPHTNDIFKMMVVIQPETAGYSSLYETRNELLKIKEHVPRQCLIELGIQGAPAYLEDVISHLPAASIVHFACHGLQEPNPLESAIVLADGRLKVSRIMQEPMPKAELVFLSACQTATGDETLPDESMHLAATLLSTGFRGAIATMWSIFDIDGPEVADVFYRELFKSKAATNDHPDTMQAARALHLAVAKLRAEGCPFHRWVPFIHMGL